MFFFFQAEDGIRDYKVTGVQTCALPISITPKVRKPRKATSSQAPAPRSTSGSPLSSCSSICVPSGLSVHLSFTRWSRSEERRVGKEGRGWRARGQQSEEGSVRSCTMYEK